MRLQYSLSWFWLSILTATARIPRFADDLQIFAGMPLPVAFASQHVDFTVTLCGFPRVEIRVAGSEACNFSQWATPMLGNHVHNSFIIHYMAPQMGQRPYVQLQFESLSAFWIVAFLILSASVARPVCLNGLLPLGSHSSCTDKSDKVNLFSTTECEFAEACSHTCLNEPKLSPVWGDLFLVEIGSPISLRSRSLVLTSDSIFYRAFRPSSL